VQTRGGTFIGRDQIIVLTGYTREHLELVLTHLREILSNRQVEMLTDLGTHRLYIQAQNAPDITLSEQAARDLLPAAQRLSSERAYLAALLVHPRFARWGQRFVPLAGQLTEQRRPPGWNDTPPEFALLEMRGEGPQRQFERIHLEDITQATEKHLALVLLGEPGAGKTTTLYRLAWQAARSQLLGETSRLPLFVPLAEFSGRYETPDAFLEALAHKQLGTSWNVFKALRRGELLLLIDALNEMPFATGAHYRQRVQAWRRFVDAWPGNQIVFTCRSLDYSEPLNLPQVEIERMDDVRVQTFLEKYLPPPLAQEAWERLLDSPLLGLVRNPYYLSMLAFVIAQQGDWPHNRARLFESFEKVLWQREAQRNHPDWPGIDALHHAMTRLGFAFQQHGEGTRMARSKAMDVMDDDAAKSRTLLHLALSASILDTESPPDDHTEEQVRFYHHQLQEYFAAHALLARFAYDEDMRPYWKQPRLRREVPSPGMLGLWDPLPPPPTTGWEETTILAAALAEDPPTFIEAVRHVNPVLAGRCLAESGAAVGEEMQNTLRQTLLDEIRDRRVHLRYRIAAGEILGHLGDPRFTRHIVNGQEVLLPPFVHLPGGTFRMGSSAWEVLRLTFRRVPATDELPRHEVSVTPFWMARYPVTHAEFACFVQAGGYHEERYWGTEAARAWLRGEATPGPIEEIVQTWRTLRDNPAQWQAFQGALSPQQRQAWKALLQMDEETLRAALTEPYQRERTQPAFWEDSRFLHPNQPVVGVTWYEALAYCAWLEEQVTALSRQISPRSREEEMFWAAVASEKYHFTLPSEAEWEYASCGREGRRYPWGSRWRAGVANTVEMHIMRTTPVGIFPDGETPAGLADLGGNVWEWTRSLYRPYPYQENDGRNDLVAEGHRVVRGGSWNINRRGARAAFRGGFHPSSFDGDLGFRVVLSLAKG